MSQELRVNPGGKQSGLGSRERRGMEEQENSKEPMKEASSTLVSLLDCDLTLTLPTVLFLCQRMNLKEKQTVSFFLCNAKTHCP